MNDQNTSKLRWDDEWKAPESEYNVLPDGEVAFEVISFEKKTVKNNRATNGADMAQYKIRATNPAGLSTTITENFVLITDCKWKIAQFFISIGLLKPKGQFQGSMFNRAVGCRGHATVRTKTFARQGTGEMMIMNEIKDFLPPKPLSLPSNNTPATYGIDDKEPF